MNENDIREIVQEEIKAYFSQTPKTAESSNLRMQADKTIHQKSQQILDGLNIQVGTNLGTTIGTTVLQKIGFYGKSAVQAASISSPSGGATFDSQSRAAINSIITALHNMGIIG